MRYKQICALITLPLFSSSVLAFGFQFTSPGFPHHAGSFSPVSFSRDSPASVSVKLAVQNKDGNLHVVDTSYNVQTTGMPALVNFPSSSEPGINYWLVAVDPSNSQNYATLGPFTVVDRMGSFNPSTSVSADSAEVYQTIAPTSSNSPSSATVIGPSSGTGATNSSPTANPTRSPDGNQSTTNGAKSSSTPGGQDENGDKSLSTGAIIGISVGGAAGAVILVLTIYHCLFRKTAAPLGTLPLTTNPNNKNTSSIQPITKEEYSPSVTPSEPITMPPMTNVSNGTQQSSPVVAQNQPSPSSVSPQNTHSYSFNAEQNYNYQPTDNNPYHQQQHFYNNNVGQYSTAPYPSHDSMPMPEHVSYQNPTMQYNQPPQQNWGPYSQQQTGESQTMFTYPSPTVVAAQNGAGYSKTETTTTEPTFSQKFEYVASDKIENNHHQKPDSPFYIQKPDESFAGAQQHSKPHERN